MSTHVDQLLALYRLMVEGRQFEERLWALFELDLLHGTCHWSQGQEAVAAGFAHAMRPDDYTFCTYRGHLHTLFRGAPMLGLFAELLGREAGILRGKGGSMHLTSVEHGAMGSFAVVGAHLPVAVGAAWSACYQGTDRVTVCFFGDGATNIGAFHEALNLAATWALPVVFVCENNLYGEFTPAQAVTAVAAPAADRAAAYGLERLIVDGNDVEAVLALATETIGRARSGGGPALVEALTYRHRGHSRADPGAYRPPEEVARWRERDPLVRHRARLGALGVPPESLDRIEADVNERVMAASEAALASPPAGPEHIERDVFADGGASWRR